MSFKKKIKHHIKRSPFLYKIRYKFFSKFRSKEFIEKDYYNLINPINEIPKIYFDVNKLIFKQDINSITDIDKVVCIAKWMILNIKRGKGLGKSSSEVLRIMCNEKGGVCSDFAQVFNNLCVINNIKVKEWGFKSISKERAISGGHSFNEFYSKELQKWVLIDTYKCIFFYQEENKNPLSVFELFDCLKKNRKVFHHNIEANYKTDEKRVNDVYLSSQSIPFLISNYHNKTYDYFLEKLHFFPTPIIHGIVYLIGKNYLFLFTKEIYFSKKNNFND